MELHYNIYGNERKVLAQALADYFNTKYKYQGAPNYEYTIGSITVDRVGSVIFAEGASIDFVEEVESYLVMKGFSAQSTKADIKTLQQKYDSQKARDKAERQAARENSTVSKCCSEYLKCCGGEYCENCCNNCCSDPAVQHGAGTSCFINCCL